MANMAGCGGTWLSELGASRKEAAEAGTPKKKKKSYRRNCCCAHDWCKALDNDATFNVPLNALKRSEWGRFLGVPFLALEGEFRVCLAHFHYSDIKVSSAALKEGGGSPAVRLVEGAMPNVTEEEHIARQSVGVEDSLRWHARTERLESECISLCSQVKALRTSQEASPCGDARNRMAGVFVNINSVKVMEEKNSRAVSWLTGFPDSSCLEDHLKFVKSHDWVSSVPQYNPGRMSSAENESGDEGDSDLDEEEPARKKRRSTILDEATSMFFTLMVLRTGIPLRVAAVFFGVSASTASRVFMTWLCILWKVHFHMIRMPKWAEVQQQRPQSYRDAGFGNLAVTLDATEFTAGRMWYPDVAHYLFSTYKHRPTVKFIVGITTGGTFSYVSAGYGGRMTDNSVVRVSGLLDQLKTCDYPTGAEVLADRGFHGLQTDLSKIGMILTAPPGNRGRGAERQFSPEDARVTAETANVRIHVERAIGGLKEWRLLLVPVTWYQLDVIGKAVQLCAALTNVLHPPFISTPK